MHTLILMSAGDDLSPNKDKGILRYVLHASDTFKTPAEFASVTSKNIFFFLCFL